MSRSRRRAAAALPLIALVAALAACQDNDPASVQMPEGSAVVASASSAPPPSPLVTVQAGGEARTLWPYTATEFSGTVDHSHPDPKNDPINLIFTGHADPRSIRAALLALDGNRAGYLPPPLPGLPFMQCTWDDAMGGNQAAYGEPEGWAGSAIQLECGRYQQLRFHVRLFKVGDWTVANAHFETIIPGTHDHQVLSWELAKQLVTADLARAQLLAAPPAETQQITPAPYFRFIHPLIYAHELIQPLHPLIDAVVINAQTIGIRTDGKAAVLQLGRSVAGAPGKTRQELVINFGQMIPKPFCAGPTDYVYVTGPLHLRQDVNLTSSGNLTRQFHVAGELTVIPVNPFTQQPIGPPSPARIEGLYKGMITNQLHSASGLLSQTRTLPGGGMEQLVAELRVGPYDLTRFSRTEQCAD